MQVQAASEDGSKAEEKTKFGYNRKDILLLGAGLIGLGYALYYGLQATGMDAGQAGNVVQLTILLGICFGYISTYIFRVANKDMTYVKQLEDYEEAVMARRLAEMPPDELDRLMTEVDEETRERAARKKKLFEAAEDSKRANQ